jgi:hypothetical protein
MVNDQRENVKKFAQAHGMTTKMVHARLQKDLELSEKSARFMTKLRVRGDEEGVSNACELFVAIDAAVS